MGSLTGAPSGIGREFAHQLADAGINVVLVARRLAMLQDLGAALTRGYGIDYRAVGVDLSEPGMLTLNTAAHLGLSHHFGERLARRGRGGIVLVSALGAIHGVPDMAHTAATKAYVASLGAGLHVELAKRGVHVTVLHPGPTRTPVMTELGLDPGKMPIPPMAPHDCVSEALRALERNRARCIPGRINRMSAALVPSALTRSMMARMLSRPASVNTAAQ
jgi:short-subunit dehydrogenase